MSNPSMEQFRNLYSLSKTLKFRLIPTEKTLTNLKGKNLLFEELKVKESCDALKLKIDELHRTLIKESLENVSLNWEPLAEALAKGKENPTALRKENDRMRLEITKLLKVYPSFKNLTEATPKKLLKEELKAELGEDSELLASMEGKATYLTGYQDIRRHLYDDKESHGTVAYRLVNENFPLFLRIREIYDKIVEIRPEFIKEVCNNLSITRENLEDALSINGYNRALTQDGITFINTIIGGMSLANGEKKQGLNELCNMHNQKTKDKGLKIPKMPMLKKQMLVERTSFSFIIEALNDDIDVLDVIEKELVALKMNKTFPEAHAFITDILDGKYDRDEIYIRTQNLSNISRSMFKSWSHIKDRIFALYASRKKKGILTEKEKDKLEKKEEFSIEEIVKAIAPDFGGNEDLALCNLMSYWAGQDDKTRGIISNLLSSVENIRKNLGKGYSLRSDEKSVAIIKNLLDELVESMHKYKAFFVMKYSNTNFAYDYYPVISEMNSISHVYDKVRNYITKKPYSTEKIQLNFGNAVLGDGWSDSILEDKCTAIAKHDGKYYLVVINPHGTRSKKAIADIILENCQDNDWERLSYKSFDPSKQIPKLMFPRTKELDQDGYPVISPAVTDPGIKALYPRYIRSKHKGANADMDFVREMIDFCRNNWNNIHPSFAKFKVHIKPSDEYESWNDFTDDLAEQMYEVKWTGLNEASLKSLEEEGDVFLFQIYCKDFSEYSHGQKSTQTLVWNNFMENPMESPFKLLGYADIYFREASIPKPFVHKAGSILVSKTTKDGLTIPGNIYKQLFHYANKMITLAELTPEAKMWLPKMRTQTAKYDIVKDARYTRDEFFLHVPFRFNNNCADGISNLNVLVRDWFNDNDDAHVIGINRGENNLIYATVIDKDSKIVEQRSFNIFNGVDYREKLETRAHERDEQRKSWATQDSIQKIKNGYLSYVIKDITDMIFKYNAVVVMEDLNMSFKSGRMAIESNIYQAFESALVKKLQYMYDKKDVTRAYQLTAKSVRMDKLSGQHGVLLFVSPWMTSKTDPRTGFIDLFNLSDITNNDVRKEFLGRFKSIRKKGDDYIFMFDYKDMTGFLSSNDIEGLWTLTSKGERITSHRDKESGKFLYETEKPTDVITAALNEAGIEVKDGLEIKDILVNSSDTKLLSAIIKAFGLVLQSRNYRRNSDEDYFISPALDEYFNTFDSREASGEPGCTDAVTAYNLARKGLYIMNKPMLDENGKAIQGFDRMNKTEWLEYLKN